MRRPTRAELQRWYAKAAEGGAFIDLEGSTGDGELSDRGNLHPVAETAEEHERLARRIDDGGSYTEWSASVLHNGPGFASETEREVWRLHTEGLSQHEIAPALTLSRWRVREHLAATRHRVTEVREVKRWQNQKRQRSQELKKLVRQSDSQALMRLAALMLRALGLGSQSTS